MLSIKFRKQIIILQRLVAVSYYSNEIWR